MVHPIISAILSLIISGLGQVINGEVKRGIILFVLAVVMASLAALVFKNWIVTILIGLLLFMLLMMRM
ncbi:MAG: hypothetical protein Q4Q14_02420 [Methanobrevibacter sp.]|nr:hypothetical protein [Methanobrevibacter sp.]